MSHHFQKIDIQNVFIFKLVFLNANISQFVTENVVGTYPNIRAFLLVFEAFAGGKKNKNYCRETNSLALVEDPKCVILKL